MKSVQAMLDYTEANFHNIFWYVVIMVSGIICAIGVLKPFVYDKIKNKQIRKVALAFSSVVLSFITALVIYAIKDWNFNYYLASAIALSVSCIVAYWFYENTCLRELMNKIGGMVLKNVANKLLMLNTSDIAELQGEAIKAVTEFRAQNVKKTTTEDKDLRGL